MAKKLTDLASDSISISEGPAPEPRMFSTRQMKTRAPRGIWTCSRCEKTRETRTRLLSSETMGLKIIRCYKCGDYPFLK